MLATIHRSIQAAREFAEVTSSWVVLISPSSEIARKECEAAFMGTLGPEDYFSGRTVVFSSGGKISLANCAEDVFVPRETTFSITFLNWGLASNKCLAAASKWRQSATRVIDVHASP